MNGIEQEKVQTQPDYIFELEEAYNSHDTGKLAEICIRESLSYFPQLKVEPASSEEQSVKNEGVDFWLSFSNWLEVVGVQFTIAEYDKEYLLNKAARYPRFVNKNGKSVPVILCEPEHRIVSLIKQGMDRLATLRAEKGDFQDVNITSEEFVPDRAKAVILAEIIDQYMKIRPELRTRFIQYLKAISKNK
jgi:hypothetical protein